jgi:hypothetical protein
MQWINQLLHQLVTLADYEFELPSVEEQNRVATLAWAAHRLKKEYHKLIEATDNLVKSQFIEMFTDTPKREAFRYSNDNNGTIS